MRSVLLRNANQPLVEAGGQRQLSEQYFDAIRDSEISSTGWSYFYDFNLCGGEPFAVWS